MPRKKPPQIKKAYIVVSEKENKFFSSFQEAEVYAQDLCDESGGEEIHILEVAKAWTVYFPEEPQPETNEIAVIELVD
jgi:hypothetical protein